MRATRSGTQGSYYIPFSISVVIVDNPGYGTNGGNKRNPRVNKFIVKPCTNVSSGLHAICPRVTHNMNLKMAYNRKINMLNNAVFSIEFHELSSQTC